MVRCGVACCCAEGGRCGRVSVDAVLDPAVCKARPRAECKMRRWLPRAFSIGWRGGSGRVNPTFGACVHIGEPRARTSCGERCVVKTRTNLGDQYQRSWGLEGGVKREDVLVLQPAQHVKLAHHQLDLVPIRPLLDQLCRPHQARILISHHLRAGEFASADEAMVLRRRGAPRGVALAGRLPAG